MKPFLCFLLASISILLLLLAQHISLFFFEIVYGISIYLPLGIAIILFFLSILLYCKERIFLLFILTITLLLFLTGLVISLTIGPTSCKLLSSYVAGEEILIISIALSLWLFFHASKKVQETVLNGKKIGETLEAVRAKLGK